MKIVIALIVTTTLLSACTSPEIWRRAGTSQQIAETDAMACRAGAARDGYSSGIYGGIAGYDYVHRCMGSLGYHAAVY
jgi:hypothetical protein